MHLLIQTLRPKIQIYLLFTAAVPGGNAAVLGGNAAVPGGNAAVPGGNAVSHRNL